jgi:hypothetical protein
VITGEHPERERIVMFHFADDVRVADLRLGGDLFVGRCDRELDQRCFVDLAAERLVISLDPRIW